MATLTETGFSLVKVELERVTDDNGVTYDQVTVLGTTTTDSGVTVRTSVYEVEQSVIPAGMKTNIRAILSAAETRLRQVLEMPPS